MNIKGFAVKFYTEEGNYDLTMLHIPAFGFRDLIVFAFFNRLLARNPVTHLKKGVAAVDFMVQYPETLLNKLNLVSDLGLVKNYRHITGFSINTFKLTGGTSAESVFVRFQLIPRAGFKRLSSKRYQELAGIDPDYMVRDLYNEIQNGRHPTWDLKVQMFTANQAGNLTFNPFDPTKYLPVKEFPLYTVGTLVLDRNPTDNFNEVEQAAYHPGNLVPGIELSHDRNLQGRMFAYRQAARIVSVSTLSNFR